MCCVEIGCRQLTADFTLPCGGELPLLHAKLFLKEGFFVLHAKFRRKIRFARSAAVAVGISERGKSCLIS